MSSYRKPEDRRCCSQSPAARTGRRSQYSPPLHAVIFIALIAALFSLSLGAAQEENDYPHGEFEEDCSLCHTWERWTPAVIQPEFDHDAASGFALSGGHAGLKCSACHTSLNFAEAPSECAGCHEDVHLGELGSDCDRCHGVSSFIDHGRMLRQHSSTRMPLTGRHRTAACEACHIPQPQGRLTWVGLPVDCYACHREDYEGTTDPDHEAAGYPTDCSLCHSTSNWGTAADHSGFPLTGGHSGLDCNACHANGQYEGTPTDCYACHQDDYNGSSDPDHRAAGFSTDCTLCHNTDNWDSDFDHSSWPLTGRHSGLDCNACHADGQYEGTPTDCYDCHREDYEREHDSGMSHDCTQCHNTDSWDSDFDHSSWPLTGAHEDLNCNACHADGQYEGTPTDCYDCHQDDYNGSSDPDHRAAGFSTDCTLCHNTSNWDSDFDHSSWPLTGAHSGLDCNACHGDGQYEGTPTNCYDCHREDYDREHGSGSGTSHNCELCHNTNSWEDLRSAAAGMSHEAVFPIYSGRHRNKWVSCKDCHPRAKNYSVVTCTGCHDPGDHNRGRRKTNRGPSVFSSDGRTCLVCHPRGESP